MSTQHTYNGYPVVSSLACRHWHIPGSSSVIRLLDGPEGFLLAVLLSWFNDKVERLAGKVLDDWGWSAPRVGRGLSSGVSNHCSGTAADVNALRHVQGKANTFSLTKRLRILAALRLYRSYSLIDWGGTWRSRDEMHFEIQPGTSRAAARRLALKVAATTRGRRVLAANPGAYTMLHQS